MTGQPTVYEALANVMGDVDAVLPERIYSRFVIPESGCWEWQGGKSSGYGYVWFEGRLHRTHRLIYTLMAGEIPDGLDLDHLCRNRCCANPEHLEPVTNAENIRRGDWSKNAVAKQLAKTHCPSGHPLSGENLYVPPPTSKKPRQRICRICLRENNRRYKARKRAQRQAEAAS